MSFLANYIDFNFDKVTFETKTTIAVSDKINITGTITNTSATISNGSIILGNNSIWKLEAVPMFNFSFASNNNGYLFFNFNDGSQNLGLPFESRAIYRNIFRHSQASLFLTPADFTNTTMSIDMVCTNIRDLAVHSFEIGDGTPFLNIIEIPVS